MAACEESIARAAEGALVVVDIDFAHIDEYMAGVADTELQRAAVNGM